MSGRNVKLDEQARRAVRASGMSRYRICKLTGMSQSTMSRFMGGGRMLPMKHLAALAELLDLELVRRGVRKGRAKRKAGERDETVQRQVRKG